MSIVLALAMDNFLIMVSDGRVRSLLSNNVLQEDYNKIIRVNKNVLVGFAGTKALCEDALSELDKHKKEDMSLELVKDVLLDRSIQLNENLVSKELRIGFTIGGIDKNNEMTIYSFVSTSNFLINHEVPKGDKLAFMILHNYVEKKEFEDFLQAKLPLKSLDSVLMSMCAFVDKIADIDPSVNKQKFYDSIVPELM